MGWTYTNRDKSQTLRQFFAKEFTPYEVVDFAVYGFREAYAILRRPDTGETVGLVILLDRSNRDGMNIGYKDMSESMGPLYTNAPLRIIERLERDAPLTDANDPSGFARKWRGKCRETAYGKRTAKRLVGARV
jgi:hypothetical protein